MSVHGVASVGTLGRVALPSRVILLRLPSLKVFAYHCALIDHNKLTTDLSRLALEIDLEERERARKVIKDILPRIGSVLAPLSEGSGVLRRLT